MATRRHVQDSGRGTTATVLTALTTIGIIPQQDKL